MKDLFTEEKTPSIKPSYKRLSVNERINLKGNQKNTFHFFEFNSLQRFLNEPVKNFDYLRKIKAYQYSSKERRVFHHQYSITSLTLNLK